MARHGTTRRRTAWPGETRHRARRGGAGRTWWRLQAELAQCRESPMQKQGRQPAGLAALRWKVPAAQASHRRPRTLGWGRGDRVGLGAVGEGA